jgi:hypothetical protein
MPLRYATHALAGNLDANTAGTVEGGTAVLMGDNARQKVRNLSALVVVDCETDTLTMTGVWQVSNDNSTWVTVTNGPQNAAGVLFATGTSGADAAITKCFQAPDAVYGWRWCRFAIVNLVATGATTDTYNISYCYRSGV